jgi:hypothetical protein
MYEEYIDKKTNEHEAFVGKIIHDFDKRIEELAKKYSVRIWSAMGTMGIEAQDITTDYDEMEVHEKFDVLNSDLDEIVGDDYKRLNDLYNEWDEIETDACGLRENIHYWGDFHKNGYEFNYTPRYTRGF